MQVPPTPQDKPRRFTLRGRQQLKRDLEHITQEMYQRNHELAETNKTLSLLRTIDALVLESHEHETLESVFTQIARAITDATEYPMVGVLTESPKSKASLELGGLSIKGRPRLHDLPGIPHPVHIKTDATWFKSVHGNLLSLETMPKSEVATMLGATEAEVTAMLAELPLKTLYLVKLTARKKLVGAILVGFFNPLDQLNDAETLLLDRLSESVGVALDNKLLAEENRLVLSQLKVSNAKLRLLDKAKDEFISMASHQLRTPLTTIKGYISMLDEGDAGELNPQQKDFLSYAYDGAERMVSLISDLLNVSRMSAGRFMVDMHPTDLVKVAADEVRQLQSHAKAKHLTLMFDNPTIALPQVDLDEGKTRQVIMNFIDNAIYYTKEGSIAVDLLQVNDRVRLTVTDTGIGVPKDAQSKLFTKFYRAANAQQTRPDGTGLGLYLAKRVIEDQGGTIVFKSTEGKGSVFGFEIPIKRKKKE